MWPLKRPEKKKPMHGDDMPDALDIIDLHDGESCIAFLFYIGENGTRKTARDIAATHGLDLAYVDFEVDADEDLSKRYYEDGEAVTGEWQPKAPGSGWTFAGKWDHEDGPMSIWIKARASDHANTALIEARRMARDLAAKQQ